MSLRSDGYEVLTAEDGKSGLEIFAKESPPIVLTDIKMPGMDGIEVLKRIKEISPETEVIVVTGHGHQTYCGRSSGSCPETGQGKAPFKENAQGIYRRS